MGVMFLVIAVMGAAILVWNAIQALRRNLYYRGKVYRAAIGQLQLVDEILGDALREEKTIGHEGAQRLIDGTAASLAALADGPFPCFVRSSSTTLPI